MRKFGIPLIRFSTMHINQPIFSGQLIIDKVDADLTRENKVNLHVLRLDKLHPVISGNKWFKLKYYLADAVDKGYRKILTFGGAYSNHIVAAACAAKQYNFGITGIIRGEEPAEYSQSLTDVRNFGMELQFLSRNEYNSVKRSLIANIANRHFNDHYIIPEGGYGELGVKGAAEILQTTELNNFTHIAAAIGTGCTIAGILQGASRGQKVLGMSVMKNNNTLLQEIASLLDGAMPLNFQIVNDYHFGGYAKKSQLLLDFMNRFYRLSNIPLDFVYTGKLMYGIFDLIGKGYFPHGAKILVIHSGGLQGNRSLPSGILEF